MTFPAYPEYKDSGIDWLGVIPAEWKTIPLSKLATSNSGMFIDGDWIESKDLSVAGIRYLTSGNVGAGYYKEQGQGYISEEKFKELQCIEVLPNDLLISRLNLPIGRACLVPEMQEKIVTCVDNVICRPSADFDRRFLVYLLSSEQHFANMELLGRGATMQRISRSVLGNVRFPVPAKEEQEVIANFLDHEIGKIDSLITEQEKLIELLNEKRQSIISNAVCRGLNPNVPMKDSGVEWLGMVPVHWNIMALKHIVSIPITDGPHETPDFYDEGIPFVSAEAVSSGEIDFSKIRGYISSESHAKYSLKYLPKRGDIFMVKSGATTGVCAIVESDVEFNIWSPLAALRCEEEVEPYFVLNYMRSINFQEAIALNWNFGTQQNIGMGVIENLMIPMPPHQEQIEISQQLATALSDSNELINEASKGISLLKERRSALISAAVCGQIDVRSFQS